MRTKEMLLSAFLVMLFVSSTVYVFSDNSSKDSDEKTITFDDNDPLYQYEGHDHTNASQHEAGTDNMELLDFNPLSTPGNAEVQVATTPDGETYAYLAGWNDMHIVDVTDPSNTTVTGKYSDPNTQVLDVKYLEYNGREYILQQNQLIDPGYADPNVGQWSDPAQVSVTLIDVTDKENPTWIDSWYDVDHPSGPHNLYTQMIDGEWYVFIANPDYEECNDAIGEACGGVTIAHLNLDGSASRNLPGVPASGIGHTIIKVGEYEVAWETTRGGWIYIHDMTVQLWPGEDPNDPRYQRTFIYGSYWEAGLRIADVTDVPHPVNSPEEYTIHATLCKTGGGNPIQCRWRAEEVGLWMDFLDLDGDGQPDSGTTGNENGGRVSYIHYAEPFPEMLDLSHLGYSDEPVHVTTAAVEVLSTSVGTGIIYLLDTTEYTMQDGQFKFKPKMIRDWEIPTASEHCYGADCEDHPNADEWLLFSPHNLDSAYFPTTEITDQSRGGTWDGRLYISHYHAGLWVVDIETLVAPTDPEDRIATHAEATVAWYLPNGEDGQALDSQFYDFGWVPYLWAVEHHNGITYSSCISTGLYVTQLDIDIPYIGSDI
jgi:hypothetical protein